MWWDISCNHRVSTNYCIITDLYPLCYEYTCSYPNIISNMNITFRIFYI